MILINLSGSVSLRKAAILNNKTIQPKNRDAETSPFPKLPLENHERIVYNHLRNNQRIFACPMIATGNLMMVLISYDRLSPICRRR